MSLSKLPKIEALTGQRWHMREDALDKWNPAFSAEASDNTISVLDVIGEDYWTGGGVTSKRVGAALRSIGDQEVIVNINSPGGDFFEGVAIYNMLRAHPNKVTVRVVGLAASAASVIAMAGDEVQIGQAGFMMIHNAWTIGVGNRHDMRQLSDTMETFDASMSEVYAAKSGSKTDDIAALMDAETWFSGKSAIEAGLADDYLPDDLITEDNSTDAKALKASAVMDCALRAQYPDMSRKERRALQSDAKSYKPGAVGSGTQDAANDTATLAAILSAFKA